MAAQAVYDSAQGPDQAGTGQSSSGRPDSAQTVPDPDSLISSLKVDVDQAVRPDDQAAAGPDDLTASLRVDGGRVADYGMDVYNTAGGRVQQQQVGLCASCGV